MGDGCRGAAVEHSERELALGGWEAEITARTPYLQGFGFVLRNSLTP